MSTTKTVNVNSGKILNYQVTKTGYKPIFGSVYVNDNKTININMVATSNSNNIYTLGDRILDVATFVGYYKPGGSYDNKPISTALISQTVGNGLINLGIKKGLFEYQINESYDKIAGEYTYDFSYNGTNWIYDGNTVVLSDYGIFYNSTMSTLLSGDTIQVKYTVYNKYAYFVLDANYRTNSYFGKSDTNFPNYPDYSSVSNSTGTDSTIWYYTVDYGRESATWCNEKLLDNEGYDWNSLPALNYCRTLGTFILPNGIQLNALIPNATELYTIYLNRNLLDSIDPIIQSGQTNYNLSNWNFSNNIAMCCQESNRYDYIWGYSPSDNTNWGGNGRTGKGSTYGVIPIFEVPTF